MVFVKARGVSGRSTAADAKMGKFYGRSLMAMFLISEFGQQRLDLQVEILVYEKILRY